jgi:hypothetical protein
MPFLLLLVFSSMKLGKRSEQALPGSEELEGGGGWVREMAQTMYAYMNK